MNFFGVSIYFSDLVWRGWKKCLDILRFLENFQIFGKFSDFQKVFRFSENFGQIILLCGARLLVEWRNFIPHFYCQGEFLYFAWKQGYELPIFWHGQCWYWAHTHALRLVSFFMSSMLQELPFFFYELNVTRVPLLFLWAQCYKSCPSFFMSSMLRSI